jgi:arylformamidase
MWMPPLYREFTSPAQIDAEYGTQQRVADPSAEARHYVDRSRDARERLRCILDQPFGPTLDETLDIFPAEQPGAPVFVFVHGGYWRANTSREFSCVALGLQPLGITTVVVNYSLCPKVSVDEITRQTRGAVAWVLRNIERHGGDPQRVAVGGHSAGGHLTAMCLQTRWAEEYGLATDPLAAAVLVSGIYDLRPLRYSYLQPQIQLDEGIIQRNSPLFAVRRCATPVLITWGEAESGEFARQSASYHAAWQAAGNRSELVPQAGAHHFSVIHGFEHSASPLCQWLARALGTVA